MFRPRQPPLYQFGDTQMPEGSPLKPKFVQTVIRAMRYQRVSADLLAKRLGVKTAVIIDIMANTYRWSPVRDLNQLEPEKERKARRKKKRKAPPKPKPPASGMSVAEFRRAEAWATLEHVTNWRDVTVRELARFAQCPEATAQDWLAEKLAKHQSDSENL